MYKIIIDANVWIRYARVKNIAPLIDRFVTYRLLPVANNYLLAEIFDALIENKWMNGKQANNVITFIKTIAYMDAGKAVYRKQYID